MRLAIFSDVHGNPVALDAVLDDIREHGGADGYWVLGDFMAMGVDPAAVLRRITALPNARFVRGNFMMISRVDDDRGGRYQCRA